MAAGAGAAARRHRRPWRTTRSILTVCITVVIGLAAALDSGETGAGRDGDDGANDVDNGPRSNVSRGGRCHNDHDDDAHHPDNGGHCASEQLVKRS